MSWRVGNFLPVMLGLWPVLALSGTLAGEAAKGSLDLLASTPHSRRVDRAREAGRARHGGRLRDGDPGASRSSDVGQAFARLPGDEIPFSAALGQAALYGVMMLAAGGAAFATAPFLGRTRGLGVGLIVLFASYLIYGYSTLSPIIEALKPLSFFVWTAGHRPIAGVTDWPSVAALAAVRPGPLRDRRVRVHPARPGRERERRLAPTAIAPGRDRAGRSAGSSPIGPASRSRGASGSGLYGILIVASADAFGEDDLVGPQIAALIEAVYPGLDLTQPSALLQLTFFSFGSFIIGLAGASFLAGWAGDEGRRRLEVVLSTPRSRASWAVRSGLGVLAAIGVVTVVIAVLIGIAIGVAGRRRRRRRSSASASSGWRPRRSPRVGLAVGGLFRPSLAAGVTAFLVIATLLIDTLGAALKLPDVDPRSVALQAPRPADGRDLRPGRDRRGGGDGRRRRGALRVRPDAARHRQVTSGGGPLDHRPGRGLGRPASRLERPAQDRRRSAPGGDDRDAGGVGRDRAARVRGLVGAVAMSPCRSRASCSGVASGVVEAAYFILLSAAYRRGDLSVVYPVARGTAPLLAVVIGVGRARRAARRGGVDRGRRCCSPGSSCSSGRGGRSRWRGRVGEGGGWRRPGGRSRARKAAADSAILFALATGVMIATYTAIDRVGTRQIDVVAYAAILWVTCSVVLVAWVAFVAGGDLLRYGPEAARRAAVGGLLTLVAYLCILVALSVAPLSGRRAAARVGDGLRRGLGLGQDGRGERPFRGGAPDRGLGADRRRGVAARGGELRRRLGLDAVPSARLGGLDRRHPSEQPPPAELAVDQPDAGDDERGPDDHRASIGSCRTR